MPALLLARTNAPTNDPRPTADRPCAEDRWLSVLDVARRFGVSHGTIYRQLRRGEFPCRAEKVGRVWRVDAADVGRFLSIIDGPNRCEGSGLVANQRTRGDLTGFCPACGALVIVTDEDGHVPDHDRHQP